MVSSLDPIAKNSDARLAECTVTICRRYGQSATANKDTQFVHVKSQAKTAVLCDMMPRSLVRTSASPIGQTLYQNTLRHIPETHNPYRNSLAGTKSHKSLGMYPLQLTKDCQKRNTRT